MTNTNNNCDDVFDLNIPLHDEHKIINTSKRPTHRRLCMFISDDLHDIDECIRDIRTDIQTKSDATTSGMITWQTVEEGKPFGLKVHVLGAEDMALHDFIAPTDAKVMYIIENGQTTLPPPVAATVHGSGSGEKFMLCLAAGENSLMRKVRALYPALPVRMLALNAGDATWVRIPPGTAPEMYDSLDPNTLEQCGPIIERKAAPDFVKTIIDERKLQLQVMLDTAPRADQIMYVIEGDIMKVYSQVDEKARIGSMIYPVIRHGTRVATLQNTDATAALLVNIHLQMETCDEAKLRAPIGGMLFGNMLNATPKKASYTGDGGRDELIRLLVVIDGVSDEVAMAIAQVYPTFTELFAGYRVLSLRDGGDGAAIDNMLADIMVTRKSGNMTKVGPMLSKRIATRFGAQRIILDTLLAGREQERAALGMPVHKKAQVVDIPDDDGGADDDGDDDVAISRAGNFVFGRKSYIREPKEKKIAPIFKKK